MTSMILLKDWYKYNPEAWKAIPGYEGYEVSTRGNVRSFWVTKGTPYKGGARCSRKRFLTQQSALKSFYVSRDGYQRFALTGNQGHRGFFVHRLVAITFLGDLSVQGLTVNHKNGIKFDNRVENLEWITSGDNTRHAHRYGLGARGERQGCSKMTEDKVRELRQCRKQGMTFAALGEKFEIAPTTAHKIATRLRWQHVQ